LFQGKVNGLFQNPATEFKSLCFIDLQGNVQGYFVFRQKLRTAAINILSSHCTVIPGVLSLEGQITFISDGFACRTRTKADERVLSLSCGPADSLLNDSLFAPESDTALRTDASNLSIKTIGAGVFSFQMSGQIDQSSELHLLLS